MIQKRTLRNRILPVLVLSTCGLVACGGGGNGGQDKSSDDIAADAEIAAKAASAVEEARLIADGEIAGEYPQRGVELTAERVKSEARRGTDPEPGSPIANLLDADLEVKASVRDNEHYVYTISVRTSDDTVFSRREARNDPFEWTQDYLCTGKNYFCRGDRWNSGEIPAALGDSGPLEVPEWSPAPVSKGMVGKPLTLHDNTGEPVEIRTLEILDPPEGLAPDDQKLSPTPPEGRVVGVRIRARNLAQNDLSLSTSDSSSGVRLVTEGGDREGEATNESATGCEFSDLEIPLGESVESCYLFLIPKDAKLSHFEMTFNDSGALVIDDPYLREPQDKTDVGVWDLIDADASSMAEPVRSPG